MGWVDFSKNVQFEVGVGDRVKFGQISGVGIHHSN